MSLVSVYRDDNNIYVVSDSSQKVFYRIGPCFNPTGSKLFLYENKYTIQFCGLGTLGGKSVIDHIEFFIKNNGGKNIHDLPSLLLQYFSNFDDCKEIKDFPDDNETLLLISGWDNGSAVVYSINTKTKKVITEKDSLVAYGIYVESFKEHFNFFVEKAKGNIKDALVVSFASVTTDLKISEYISRYGEIDYSKPQTIINSPEYINIHVAVDAPYDYAILSKGGSVDAHIDTRKEKEDKWLNEPDIQSGI